jgi:hypothetical protein
LNRLVWVALCLLLAAPVATLAQSEPRDAVQYDIFIACPGGSGVCPIQAWDGADALGSPAIAVDPDDVDNMIIASLHGYQSDVGPEARSRAGLKFTTHTSTNHGASWLDKPYSEPSEMSSAATGEHPGIALDPYGHVFVSSMYAVPTEDDGGGPWNYVIAAQKFASLQDINNNQDGQYNVDYVDSVYDKNRIAQTWFVYDPVGDQVVLLWHESPLDERATAEDDPGNATPAQQVEGIVRGVLDKLPPPPAPAASAEDAPPKAPKYRSAISWVYTSADVGDAYHTAKTSVIEPCEYSTNPVVSEGWLYVGCLVAGGEGAPTWAPDAEPGEIHMFRFKPEGGAPEYLGQSPLVGGRPKLGVRSDGRMALMTTEVVEVENATRIRLDGVYGQYDPKIGQVVWGEVHEYGDALQVVYANMPLVETNIQDLIYREYSGVIHMVFKRVAEWPESNDASYSYKPEYYKAIVAIDEHYGFLEEIDLDIGTEAHRLKDGSLYSNPADLYNDLSDDFLELPPEPFEYLNRPLGDEYQREFYAVGNYGFVDFAELIEVTELRGPAAAGLPNPPPPPNPSPATSTSLVLGFAGSLTASAIVAGSAATVKRKSSTRARRGKKK